MLLERAGHLESFHGRGGRRGSRGSAGAIEDEDLRWEAAEDGGFPSGFSLPGWWISFQQWAFSPFWALINDVVLPLKVEGLAGPASSRTNGFVNAARVFQSFGEALFGVLADHFQPQPIRRAPHRAVRHPGLWWVNAKPPLPSRLFSPAACSIPNNGAGAG